MRLRMVRVPGGGCRPRGGPSSRGGDCVSADGGKLVIPRWVELEGMGGWVVVRGGWSLSGGVCVSAAGGKLVIPREVDLERVGGRVVGPVDGGARRKWMSWYSCIMNLPILILGKACPPGA